MAILLDFENDKEINKKKIPFDSESLFITITSDIGNNNNNNNKS